MKSRFLFAILFLTVFSIIISENAYGSLSLDKGSYSWTDKVKIRLMVHGFDHKHDTIQISIGNNELKSYKLSKAGNGLYTGEVILTGFLHDVSGDGKPDTNPRTIGNGPNNGFLESIHDEDLEVLVRFQDGTKIKTTTKIAWNVGKISFDMSNYQIDQTSKLQATDPDMNLNPETLDKLPIHVFSDSDKAGILIDAIETEEESGIFETTVSFTQNSVSSGNRLFAISGDTIYAQYTDHTLPKPYDIHDDLEIVAESTVHDSLIAEPEQDEPIPDNCEPGTIFEDGICIEDIENSTMSSSQLESIQNTDQESNSDIIPSPLKQMKMGIKLGHVICDKDKYPVWNTHYKPACVYSDTESELIKRGWAKLRLMLPAGPDPIKELDWTGRNVMSMMLDGTFSYSSTPVETIDEKKDAIDEYSKQYHLREQYLEYAITSHQYYYNVGDKVQFELLEWGKSSKCPNLQLRIIDMYDQSVFEHITITGCVNTGIQSVIFNSYSMGDYFDEFVCDKYGYYRIEVSNGDIFTPTILQNFACLKPETNSLRPDPGVGWVQGQENSSPSEPEKTSNTEMKLRDARKFLQNAYQNQVNLGPYHMKDVVMGFATYEDRLIVDIASKYTNFDSFKIIKQELQHIVGKDIDVDYVIYDEPIERHIETVIPYLWNKILHQKNVGFQPKEMSYFNNADGFLQHDKVCSPLVAPNGTEFYILSTFDLEPFEITGTYIDKIRPDDCHKIWRIDVLMPEPDRVTALWLENED